MRGKTILITGANGQVGSQLLTQLRDQGNNLIALVRNDLKLPANQIITDWLHSDQAKEAIAKAEIIVHLAGSLKPKDGNYIKANIIPTQTLISHLNPAQNTKIIFLSYLGASPDASNPYLATKGQVENMLQSSGYPVTIFRCGHIIGSPDQPGITAENLISKNGKSISVLGSGKEIIMPIYLKDVITAIIAAINQDNHGIFDLVGLEAMTMDNLVTMVNRNQRIKINHIPDFIAKLLPFFIRDLPRGLVDTILADSVGNPQSLRETFKLELTSLKQLWNNEIF